MKHLAWIALIATASSALAAPHNGTKKEPKKEPKKDKEPVAAPAPAPEPPPTPPPAPGDRRRIIGILDVKVDGVPPEIAAQFQKDLEAQLDMQQYWLAPRSRMRDLMSNSTKWTEGCLVGPCVHEVKTQTSAELVLLAALNGSGTSFGYVVTLVRTDTGHVLSQQSARCDVCTVNEALTNATKAAVKLLLDAPPKLPDENAAHDKEVTELKAELSTVPAQLAVARKRDNTPATVVLIGGLLVGAAGAALYVANNHANYGLATAAAGAGMATAGVIVLAF